MEAIKKKAVEAIIKAALVLIGLIFGVFGIALQKEVSDAVAMIIMGIYIIIDFFMRIKKGPDISKK